MNIRFLLLAIFITCIANGLKVNAQNKKIDSLKQVLSKMPDDSNKVNTMRLLIVETIDKRNDEATTLALKQVALSKKIGYEKGEALAYRLLSVTYESNGDMQNAIESALKSLKICEKLHDKAGVAGVYNNIGVVYIDENESLQALSYFKKSLDINRSMKGREEHVWRGQMNMGRIYEQLHKDTLALAYYMQSLNQSKLLKENQLTFKSNSLFHVSGIYFYRKQYPLSKTWLLKALGLVSKINEAKFPHLSEMYLLLSKIYIVQNEFADALPAAKKGLEIGKKFNFKALLPNNYLQVSKSYAALGNFQEAYRFQTLYTQLKDSMVNAENVKAIEKLQYNYKLQKKEDANAALLKDKKINDSQILLQKITIQRQYALGAFIITALLSSLVLSLFYYRSLQQKKKDNERLVLSQQEILQQNHEITAQNEEIVSQKEQLEQINNTKDKLFSIISHDLRAPVLTLHDSLTLFNKELLTHEEITSLSGELLDSVTNTSTLLDNVLYWAKSQMDGINVNKQAFDIETLITSNLQNFKKQATNKQIKLIDKVEQSISVMADASTIDIVLRNLISNAIKFCNTNDSIAVSATVKETFLQLSITDTGLGMSKETQQRLFKPAVYHSTYGTANEKGTGLGLNLCRDFVTLNGGTIWVESEPGKGSVFTFTIPLV
jgi:signal transduction histidine kinase